MGGTPFAKQSRAARAPAVRTMAGDDALLVPGMWDLTVAEALEKAARLCP